MLGREVVEVIPMRHRAFALDRHLVAVTLGPFADQANAGVDLDPLVGRIAGAVRDFDALVSHGIAAKLFRARGMRKSFLIASQPIPNGALG